MPETTAEFLITRASTAHKCGAVTDMIGGDIEMNLCPKCLECDMQAVFALQAALTAFKATGMQMLDAPLFNEVEGVGVNHQSSVRPPEYVRIWTFYAEFEVDDEDDDDEYYAYIILKADGKYEVFRAP